MKNCIGFLLILLIIYNAYLVDADEEQLDQKNENVNNDEPTNIDNNEEKLKSSSNGNTDNNNENNKNNDNNDRTVRDTQNKGTVNSEKVTLEEQLNENLENTRDNVDSKNNYDDDLKPVEISKVKVIQDNVTGHKRSSFSEDKSSNRGDENTVSHIKEEVENRILEKQKNQDGDGEPLVAEDNDESSNVDLEESEHPDEQAPPDHDELPPEDEEPPLEPDNREVPPPFMMDNPDEKMMFKEEEEEEEGATKETKSPEATVHTGEKVDLLPKDDDEENIKSTDDPSKLNNGDNSADDGEIPKSLSFQSNDEFESVQDVIDKGILFDSGSNNEAEPAFKLGTETDFDESNQKTDHTKEEEKVEPIKSLPIKERKPQPGADQYDIAMSLLNKKDANKGHKIQAYKLLAEAADLNNTDAAEKIAYPYMFGDYIKRNRTKAVELFHYLASKGNPLGQQGLGFIYGGGLNVNSSQAKALIYTTFAALGGNAMASMMLGYRYLNGIGVAKSCESALTHYKKVAKKVTDETTSHGGSAVQRIRLYDELEQPGGTSGQIDEDLLQYYQFLADKGDLQAQVGLGQLYFQGGRGIDVNYEKAFKYFQLAGDVDNGNGLAYLGKMYLDGLFVEKDQKKAFEYFTKAAEQSNPIGQAGLGMIYLKGAGVKKDYDQAMKYFSQAAEQGWMEGQLQLGNMYYNGIGVKKDYRQAVKYFTFASQSGHVMAFYNLASMHATGAGVMRSCATATELFKNVAERGKWSMMFMDAYDSYRTGDLDTALLKYYYLAELGYEVAQSNVAYVLEKGELTWFPPNQTYARALLQWSRAAHQGYAVARVKVGDYHFYGYGTKVDYDAAALHYRTASDQQNNPQAMFNLGYMHEQGFGLKEDIHLAKRFYDMAAEASPDAHFPVSLALMKLTLFFTWDWIKQNYRFWEYRFWEDGPIQRWWTLFQSIDTDWDMILITGLAIILGALLLFRRTLRR